MISVSSQTTTRLAGAPAAARSAIVLGGGIAGLAVAEVLSRNHHRVTLIERQDALGGEASLRTQKWLHSGWLYAALPYRSAMRACNAALRCYRTVYGHVLPGEVMNIARDSDRVHFEPTADGWFDPTPVLYLFATATYDLATWQRVLHRQYLRWIALRRLRALGYDTRPLRDLPAELDELLTRWEGVDDAVRRYLPVQSTDARIETRRVMRSLVGLLGEHVEVVTGAEARVERYGTGSAVIVNGERMRADVVVLAAGRGVPAQLVALGRADMAGCIKSIRSPVVVLDRCLPYPSFIRFTPNLPQTINHIRYTVPGVGEVSTIGCYDYYPADVPDAPEPDIEPVVEKACRRLGVSTSLVAGRYYGIKTEYTGALDRRYNHAVAQVNGNTWLTLAGKLSQFPLLVADFARHLSLRIDLPASAGRCQSPDLVAPTVPESIVNDHAARAELARERAGMVAKA